MLKKAALLAMLMGGPAAATQEYTLPTLFDVAGVAADDVLNIRQTPSASAPIVATLAPNATHVEVVGLDRSGQWGQVNTGEQSGWVSMRFLNYRTDVWQPARLPDGFACFGTEPFWSFRQDGDAIMWDEPDRRTGIKITDVLDSGIFRDPRRIIRAEDDHNLLVATVTPKQCSDGMSERSYGLEATVLLQRRNTPARMYTGCCSIGPR
ncbi:SH3 domain-containing protein [Paracoccus aurantiacus]|uniref:SH3 domain-containing protein n=1 Tax=Paracoccus aurantiacus TaxID=2599412 RepID=A0A5C6S7R0_9RHOB|nr:SH3 domain-containing protein [Paracoccus aurantiacus]TXB69684.1 SH3 domain-containing protein [Paracoccus aurantiacus]